MRFFAKITTIKFNSKRYTNALRDRIKQSFLIAAGEFLSKAAPAVPIYTGMARGSFLNMLQLVKGGASGVDIPTTPQRTDKFGRVLSYYHYDSQGSFVREYNPNKKGGGRLGKEPELARKLSTPTDKILTLFNNQWRFTYEVRVYHFNLNDFERGWNSFELGRQAFESAMANEAKIKQDNIEKYILRTVISRGRTNPVPYLGAGESITEVS